MAITPQELEDGNKFRAQAGLPPLTIEQVNAPKTNLTSASNDQAIIDKRKKSLGLDDETLAAKAATQQKTDHPGEVDPSFKASIGGANTILPNIAKTIGNIPSDALGTVGAAVVTPAKNIGDSLKTATDIYKDRGAVQGTKDIAAGFGDTAAKIFKAPGEALVGAADKTDLIDHLSPIQEQAIKQRDTIMQKITDAKKEGKNTSNLVAALKIVQENLTSLNDQIGSKEDRQNKGVEDLTNIAKYPIEHPVQTAVAAESLKPETQAAISEKLSPVTDPIASKVQQGANIAQNITEDSVAAIKSKLGIKPVADPVREAKLNSYLSDVLDTWGGSKDEAQVIREATRQFNADNPPQMTNGKSLKAIQLPENLMTKSQKIDAINAGRQAPTKLGGVKYAPSETDSNAAKLLEGKLTGNAAKDVPIVKNEISTLGKEAETYLEKNKIPITAQEQSDMFETARKAAEKDLTETELKNYDEQMKLFLKQLPGRGGYTTDNFYKGLKDYEANIADKLPRGKEALLDPTGIANAKIRAASDIRRIVRDAIAERHPEFKKKMFNLASLYDAKSNIITKAANIKGNAITRAVRRHPVVTAAIVGESGRKILTGGY